MLSFILHDLCKNLEVQGKLRAEIQKYFKENSKISYETVAIPSTLPYLDRVVQESLRIHTISCHVDRVCTKPDGYSLEPLSSFIIPCGMPVLIPLYGLAHDEKYYSDPWTFNPDRSDVDSRGKALPFGSGLRSCIGERLALIIIKTALVKILKDFRVEPNAKTPENLTIGKKAFILYYNEILNASFVMDPIFKE